jgi:Carboxypeptidase regulatory-like domain
MRLCFRLLLPLLLAPTAPTVLAAQTGNLSGVVVSADHGERLGYSVVAAMPGNQEAFTSDSGTFRFTDLPAGPVRLRVRHLGYSPRDTTVDVVPAQTTAVRVALTPVVLTLSTMRVVAERRCTRPGPPDVAADSTLGAVFDQLQQNADRYRLLMRRYPFRSTYEVTDAAVRPSGTVATIDARPAVVESDNKWSYAPGGVVRNRGRIGAWVNIPTLDVFADQHFVDAHCFWYAGLEPVNGDTLLRIDFRVADRIHEPDLDGSMYLDPQTYLIHESRLRLSRLPRSLDHGDSAIMVTRFDELLPGVPFIADVLSTLHIKPGVHGTGPARLIETEEERRRTAVKFLRERPELARVAEVAPIVAPYTVRPPEKPRIMGVFDAESGAPLDSVMVTDSITQKTGRTTRTGTVRLDFISQAGGVLTLRKTGYTTSTLHVSASPRDTVPITVLLSRPPARSPGGVEAPHHRQQVLPHVGHAVRRRQAAQQL